MFGFTNSKFVFWFWSLALGFCDFIVDCDRANIYLVSIAIDH